MAGDVDERGRSSKRETPRRRDAIRNAATLSQFSWAIALVIVNMTYSILPRVIQELVASNIAGIINPAYAPNFYLLKR